MLGLMSTHSSGGVERFLSRVTAHVLDHGYRTPEDFMRTFPPAELMAALSAAPELRKDILVAAGLHEKIARRKSAESAAEDLRIALDEGITSASIILELLKPEDRVRYLDRAKLFGFAVEDGYFSGQKTGSEHERAVDRLLSILESAIAEGLLSSREIASAIGIEPIVHRLPLRELQRALERALTLGSRGEPFTDLSLFETIPLRSILSYVPLEQVWAKVAVAKILAPLGLADAQGRHSPGSFGFAPSRESARALAMSQPPAQDPNAGSVRSSESDELLTENDVDTLLENVDKARESLPSIDDEDIRTKVLERLAAIGRQPPRHAELSIPILLSIESMYAELLEASTDEAREECIRESFPNEPQMIQALLALIELLDPSIDVNEPVIRDADLDSLIKVFVFEERHRYEQLHPPQRSGTSSPPVHVLAPVPPLPPSAIRRTAPPPLPRSGAGGPPPLPGEKAR